MEALDLCHELLDWSEPITRGRKVVSQCHDVPHEFWALWKEHKDEFKQAGIRVGRDEDDGHFFATWVRSDDEDRAQPQKSTGGDDRVVNVLRFLKAPPEFAIQSPYLHPDQRDAVHTVVQAIQAGIGFTLDASEAGIGKTWIALEAVKRLGINFGVVCPANVVTKWTDTAVSSPFGVEPEFVLSYEKLRSARHGFTEKKIIRKKTHFDWGTTARAILIFDEIHYCSGQDSLNSKLLKAAIDDPNITVHGLSATVADSPLDMRAIGYGLELHKFGDWWMWCKKNGCRPGPFGGLIFSTGDGSREPTPNQKRARAKLSQIHAHIFPKRGVRLTVEDAGVWRPKNMVMAELVDVVEENDKRVLKAMKELNLKEAADFDRAEAKEMNVSPLTMNTRDRQRAELLKIPILVERTLELRGEGNSVIVFLNYSASINLMRQLLGKHQHLVIEGGMSRTAYDLTKADFQRNRVRTILVQFDAGAQSIDLDDVDGKFPRCTLISPSYSAKRLYQALGRAFRPASTKSLVRQWLIFATGTVEERVGRLCQVKVNAQALINDGDLSGAVQLRPN